MRSEAWKEERGRRAPIWTEGQSQTLVAFWLCVATRRADTAANQRPAPRPQFALGAKVTFAPGRPGL